MEFKLLGPLEASDGSTTVALAGRKQRALLARLLLDANRTVATDRLVDDLWGEDVPESAQKMVQIYVSQLRKVLPEGHAPDPPAGVRDRGRPGGDRPRPLRAASARGGGGACRRERRARGRALPRGARALARRSARRVPGAVRARRGGAARGAAPRLHRGADRRRPRSRASRRARRRARARWWHATRCARACARSSCSRSTARDASPRRSPRYQAFRTQLADELGLEPSAAAQGARARDPPPGLRPRPRLRRRRAPQLDARTVRYVSERRRSRSPTRWSARGRSTSCSCTAGCAASSRAGSARRSRASTGARRRSAG